MRDIQVQGKRVLCRVDFNVPLDNGAVADDTRIRAAIPTITYLLEQGAKVILISHLGRPQGQVVSSLRMDPVAERLAQLLGQKVDKLDTICDADVHKHIAGMREGHMLLVENVRFDPREERNDPQFAKQLADLAEIFVHDAFGTAHRAHASTEGVAHHLPAVAGFLMEKELQTLGKALRQPERPFTAIIGGAKVKDKIGVIKNLLDKVDHLLIGGGLSNTFIKAMGHDVGQSLLEEDKLDLARSLIEQAKVKGVNLVLPLDCVIADAFSEKAATQVVAVENIPAGWQALDLGPKTVERFRDAISASKLVIWNGPLGVFEMAPFARGTNAVAKAVADCQGTTIIGGGDSAAAVEKAGLTRRMTHISTGGGASLELMEGKELPGVAVLQNK